jgi:hypothetical protein
MLLIRCIMCLQDDTKINYNIMCTCWMEPPACHDKYFQDEVGLPDAIGVQRPCHVTTITFNMRCTCWTTLLHDVPATQLNNRFAHKVRLPGAFALQERG